MTISNEVSTDPGIHPVTVPAGLLEKVTLVHLSWSEVMHEIRMLLSHHPFTDPLPMWILAELLKYLEHPRSGTMAFHDMGVTWVPVREAVAAGTLRSGDRKTNRWSSRGIGSFANSAWDSRPGWVFRSSSPCRDD